jgi:hypothetical protein
MRIFTIAIAAASLCGPACAGIIIGTPADAGSGNCFPFGCTGTRYQQVYAASNFTGPINIGSIGFFHTQFAGGNYNGGQFTFSLSTTSKAVNGLDTTVFNNNLGADNQLFTIVTLAGAAPAGEVLFSGTPFAYNPSQGNLLVDIVVSGAVSQSSATYFDTRSENAAGVFSRAHNFGSVFNDTGLVTEFNSADPSNVPEPASFLMVAGGLFALLRFRRTL